MILLTLCVNIGLSELSMDLKIGIKNISADCSFQILLRGYY